MLQPPSERGQADERAQAAPLEADPGAQSAGDPTHGSGGYMGPSGASGFTVRVWCQMGELEAVHPGQCGVVTGVGE
jgi:hypothetical protein